MLVAWQGAVWYFFECNRSQFINWIHSSKVDITPEWGDFQKFGQNRWFWRFPIPSSWILTHATLVFGHSDPYIWPKYTETLLISPMVKIWFQEVHPCNHRLLLLSNDYFCFYPYLKDKVSIPKPQVLAGGAPKDPKAHLGLAREEFSMLSSNFSCHAIAVDIGGNQPHPSRPKIWESWGSHSSQAADGLLPDQRGRPSHPTFGGIWVWKWATAYFFFATKHGENDDQPEWI